MFVILWISWEQGPSLSSIFVYIISILVGRYFVCYIDKSLPLRRLDFFDRRHVCHLSRSGLRNMQWWLRTHFGLRRVQTRLLFFTLSCVSLKTSSKKAWSKSRSYHDSDYEPRIHASLAGVNEKKYLSLVAAAQRRCEYLLYFFIFHLPTNSYPALLYYSYWQGKHKTAAILGGSHQAAASSG